MDVRLDFMGICVMVVVLYVWQYVIEVQGFVQVIVQKVNMGMFVIEYVIKVVKMDV